MRDGYQNITVAGAELIAISGDSQFGVRNAQNALGNPFLLLSDPNWEAIEPYNVVDQNNGVLARPATFIIDEEGQIAWSHLGVRYGQRTTSTQIIEGLNSL